MHILWIVIVSAVIGPIRSSVCTLYDYREGDIMIAYVDNYSIATTRLQNMASFITPFTEPDVVLPGFTVGYLVCHVDKSTSKNAGKLLLSLLEEYPTIVAVVGVRSYKEAISVSSLASAINIPIFTFSNGVLLDNIRKTLRYRYLIPITSSAKSQCDLVIPDILRILNINFISVVYDSMNELDYSAFFRAVSNITNGMEIYGVIKYTGKEAWTSYFESENDLHTTDGSRFQTYVVFISSENMQTFMSDLVSSGKTNLILVMDSTSYDLGLTDIEKNNLLKRNIFFFRVLQDHYRPEWFVEKLQSFQYNTFKLANKWYDKFCDEKKEECQDFGRAVVNLTNFSRYNGRIYFTVKKILKALQTVPSLVAKRKLTFRELMLKSSEVGKAIRSDFVTDNYALPDSTEFLRFSSAGNMYSTYTINVSVSENLTFEWNEDKYFDERFRKDVLTARRSIKVQVPEVRFKCSLPCKPGQRVIPNENYRNCWECENCTGNTISYHGNTTICTSCNSSLASQFYANTDKTACTEPPRHLSPFTTFGKIVLVLVIAGIILHIVTFMAYINFWNERMIMASDRHISCIIFVGIAIGHIIAILLTLPPSSVVCLTIQILGHIFMMLTVSPLLVKTIRVWLLFKFSVKLGKKLKKLISIRIILMELLFLIVPQLIFLSVDVTNSFRFRGQLTEEEYAPALKVTLLCAPGDFLITYVSVTYTICILVVSTIIGFLCRKIPDNFNESLHIFLCSLISLLLIASYLPAMVQLAGFNQVFSLACILTLISTIVNLIMFVPRIYAVVFILDPKPNGNTYLSVRSHGSLKSQIVSTTA